MADLSVSVQESLRILDFVYGAVRAPGVAAGLMASGPPAIRLTDQDPVPAMSLAVSVSENLQIDERIFGVVRNAASLSAGLEEIVRLAQNGTVNLIDLQQPRLHLSDSDLTVQLVTVGGDLSVTAGAENLKVSDAATPALQLAAQGADENLKLSESVSAALSFNVNPGDESLKISDAVTAALQLAASAGTENLHVTDSVTAALQLAAAAATENLKISDAPSTTLDPEVAAPGTENLKISDTVAAAIMLAAQGADENLKISDAATVVLDLGALGFDETLHLTDGPPVAQLGWRAALGDEPLKISDTAAAALQLAVQAGDENVHVTDAASGATSGFAVVVSSEALKISDAVTAELQRAVQAANENLHITDAVTALMDLAAAASENLKISDAATTASQLTLVVDAENVHVVDTAPHVYLGDLISATPADEGVKISESVQAPLSLSVMLEESLRLRDLAVPWRHLPLQSQAPSNYVPRTTPIVWPDLLAEDPPKVKLMHVWDAWFRTVQQILSATATRLVGVSSTAQTAAIATTPLSTPNRQSALCRLTARLRIRTAATASSSLTLTVGWTDPDGVPGTSTLTLATNVLGDQATLSALLDPDIGAAITYAVAYTSVGATPVAYDLDLVLETLPA